jgi:hypothetical protein
MVIVSEYFSPRHHVIISPSRRKQHMKVAGNFVLLKAADRCAAIFCTAISIS